MMVFDFAVKQHQLVDYDGMSPSSSGRFDYSQNLSCPSWPPIRMYYSYLPLPLSAVRPASSLQMSLLMARRGREKHATRRPLNHLTSKAICQLEGGDVEHLASTWEQRCTAVASPTHKQCPVRLATFLPSGLSSNTSHLP